MGARGVDTLPRAQAAAEAAAVVAAAEVTGGRGRGRSRSLPSAVTAKSAVVAAAVAVCPLSNGWRDSRQIGRVATSPRLCVER